MRYFTIFRPRKQDRQYLANSAPFYGHSTNKEDYTGQTVPKQKSFKPDNKAVLSETPFEDITTNKELFKKHPVQLRWPIVTFLILRCACICII